MKLFVASALIALMVAAAALAVMRMRGMGPFSKGEKAQEGEETVSGSDDGVRTTQDLIRIAGFDGHCAVELDGTRVIFIHVEGKNLSFATALEKDADAEMLGIALAGMRRPYRIHRCQRPIDMTVPISDMKAQIAAIDDERTYVRSGQAGLKGFAAEKKLSALAARKELIEKIYLPQALDEGSQKYETDIYVTMGFEDAPGVAVQAAEEASAFIALLATANYNARVMEPAEVTERLVNYWGRFPVKAENMDPYSNHDKEQG